MIVPGQMKRAVNDQMLDLAIEAVRLPNAADSGNDVADFGQQAASPGYANDLATPPAPVICPTPTPTATLTPFRKSRRVMDRFMPRPRSRRFMEASLLSACSRRRMVSCSLAPRAREVSIVSQGFSRPPGLPLV